MPADPNLLRVFDQPKSVLWDVYPDKNAGNQAEPQIESSGDAVLDSLRKQLLTHGASGPKRNR